MSILLASDQSKPYTIVHHVSSVFSILFTPFRAFSQFTVVVRFHLYGSTRNACCSTERQRQLFIASIQSIMDLRILDLFVRHLNCHWLRFYWTMSCIAHSTISTLTRFLPWWCSDVTGSQNHTPGIMSPSSSDVSLWLSPVRSVRANMNQSRLFSFSYLLKTKSFIIESLSSFDRFCIFCSVKDEKKTVQLTVPSSLTIFDSSIDKTRSTLIVSMVFGVTLLSFEILPKKESIVWSHLEFIFVDFLGFFN